MDDLSDLHFAAAKGDTVTVEALLRQGAKPNKFDEISFTPIHYAAQNGHLDVITLLLNAGADVNAHEEARIRDTPLGKIAGNCSLAVAQALVTAGAGHTIRGWMQLSLIYS